MAIDIRTLATTNLVVQLVLIALVLIIIGAQIFVGQIIDLSASLGINATALALIISPFATELPEKFNSVIWVRQGKLRWH